MMAFARSGVEGRGRAGPAGDGHPARSHPVGRRSSPAPGAVSIRSSGTRRTARDGAADSGRPGRGPGWPCTGGSASDARQGPCLGEAQHGQDHSRHDQPRHQHEVGDGRNIAGKARTQATPRPARRVRCARRGSGAGWWRRPPSEARRRPSWTTPPRSCRRCFPRRRPGPWRGRIGPSCEGALVHSILRRGDGNATAPPRPERRTTR